uniref:Thioredoxin domain-containing protein n=1 Tax=Branchiostoma floridae TaxID=7739 RepID=C3ZAI8_BRAFL|eukprot:XP_002594380.1 hypothetical protein BRAFLDRAFT_72212 [Branchiostoma floridae]
MASKNDAFVATLCCFLAISPCLLAAQSSSTLQDTKAYSQTVGGPKDDILEITLEDGSVSFETKLARTHPEANRPPVAGAATTTGAPARPSPLSGVKEDTAEESPSSPKLWDIKELTASDYDSLITNAFSQPACILFSSQRRGASVIEKVFLQVLATSEVQEELSSVFSVGKIYDPTLMDVASIISIPRARPSLCCYRGETPVCFYGDHSAARLKDWLYMQKNEAENLKTDIHAISVDRELHTNEVTVLGFARTEDQSVRLCKIFQRLEKLFPVKVKTLIVPWESPDTRKITQQFSVNTFPAVLLVSKANPHQPFKHLIGHDLTLSTIELHIEATLQKVAVQLTSENFQSRVLEQRYAGPILVKAVKETGGIPVLTGSNWDQVISTTHAAPSSYGLPGSTSLVQVVAVTFIKANCGTCAKKMPELELVHKAVERMTGVSFYIFNCSSDPGRCEHQGIRGFPTLTAYRVVQNKRVEHCTQDSTYNSIRLDYHDVLGAIKVLEWLSQVTEPATRYVSKTKESDFQDVALFAEVAPDIAKGYPFKCLEYLCEQLYGQVACYVLSKQDAVGEAAMLRVSLYRSDGLKAPVFVAGQPLALVMESESETQLHHFHSPHKYNLMPDTLCEDDAAFCTDTLLSFIRDHSRLPVMHITQQVFHTQQRQLLFNTDMPILIALGHASNFTQESPFYKNLYSAALSMYKFMSFATLDVDMYPMWAGQFVPLGYRREMLETTDTGSLHLNPPTLYTYPRLCIVRWHDHRFAAFYPDLEEKRWQRQHRSFTSSEIVKFAEDFLEDPEKLLTRTEMF